MQVDEARRLLLMHGSGTFDASGQAVWLEDGFLGMLRPYRGLRASNFHLVMQALLVVGERFQAAETVDRRLIESLWSMFRLARLWGIAPGGMLQRNKLITPNDTALLGQWIDLIEESTLCLLGGRAPYEQVSHYAEYIVQHGHGENIDFFIPLMRQFLEHAANDNPGAVAEALGKLGPQAASALPALRAAATRKYPDYCHSEAQADIAEAIRRIEQ